KNEVWLPCHTPIDPNGVATRGGGCRPGHEGRVRSDCLPRPRRAPPAGVMRSSSLPHPEGADANAKKHESCALHSAGREPRFLCRGDSKGRHNEGEAQFNMVRGRRPVDAVEAVEERQEFESIEVLSGQSTFQPRGVAVYQ